MVRSTAPIAVYTVDTDMLLLAANHMSQQMAQMNPAAQANPFQPGQDPDKMFQSEAENLAVMEHYCILDGIEERLLQKLGAN